MKPPFKETIAYQLRDKLADAYRKGHTQEELAKQYGITRHSVWNALVSVMDPAEYSECRLRNRQIANGGKHVKQVPYCEQHGILDTRHPMFAVRACIAARKKP